MDKYKITIGLEVHVALKTKSKLFSRSACEFDINEFSFFDAALPGMLPVLSEEPVKMALKFAHSVNAEIPLVSIFERKHYFYPDLPLGYQITQQHNPIMNFGKVPIELDGKIIEVQIEHAHLECDAAKSMHDKFSDYTAIDLSRGSSPLLEIVTTPCMHSTREAKLYAQTVCDLVKYLDICDGKLEEGSFRVDASISLSKTEKLGTRVEIKNISSFSFLQAALDYEIERQTEVLDAGGQLVMETRLFDEATLTTHSMRTKETVQQYRYMPDPDIIPLVLSEEMIEGVKSECDVYYFDKRDKLQALGKKFDIKFDSISGLLTSEYKSFWQKVLTEDEYQTEKFLKMLAFWIPDAFSRTTVERKLSFEDLLELDRSQLSASQCKEALLKWSTSQLSMKECFPETIPTDELESLIKTVLSEYPEQVEQYRQGQVKLFQFLIGKVMGSTKGKANPVVIKEIVVKQLS